MSEVQVKSLMTRFSFFVFLFFFIIHYFNKQQPELNWNTIRFILFVYFRIQFSTAYQTGVWLLNYFFFHLPDKCFSNTSKTTTANMMYNAST